MPTSGVADTAVPAHRVTVYNSDEDLVAQVASYFAAHLVAGGSAIVIATETHRHALSVALEGHGLSTRSMARAERYVALDAAATLASFLDNGRPDATKFVATVGAVVERMTSSGQSVLAFGEMVGLLWDQGNVAGAMALEEMWNRLAARHGFGLLCGYRADSFETSALQSVNDMCAAHDIVTVPRSYSRPSEFKGSPELSPVFLPVAPAAAAARAFVAEAALRLGLGSMAADLSIVVSELATNAIRHTASAFRVSLRVLDDVVRLEVHDAGMTYPALGAAGLEDLGGRGLAIIGQLARDWGFANSADGKMTWAELRLH